MNLTNEKPRRTGKRYATVGDLVDAFDAAEKLAEWREGGHVARRARRHKSGSHHNARPTAPVTLARVSILESE